MAAAVLQILILPLALRAQGKRIHRRAGPVIGKTPDDGIPGPAGSTGKEGILEMAVIPVMKLLPAGRADGDIRRKKGSQRLPAAFYGRESRKVFQRDLLFRHFLHSHRIRRFLKFPLQRQKGLPVPGSPDFHHTAQILHPARKTQRKSRPADKRTESHPLYSAFQQQTDGMDMGHGVASFFKGCAQRAQRGAASPLVV